MEINFLNLHTNINIKFPVMTQIEKKWYQKWWGIALIVVFFLSIISSLFKGSTCGCSENDIVELQKSLMLSRSEAIDYCCEIEEALN